jgi:hypothetical protein
MLLLLLEAQTIANLSLLGMLRVLLVAAAACLPRQQQHLF